MSDEIGNGSKKMKTGITGVQIKANARKLFLSHGLKSVSMDDLSKHAGISKKTIYQYFADKDALVHANRQ